MRATLTARAPRLLAWVFACTLCACGESGMRPPIDAGLDGASGFVLEDVMHLPGGHAGVTDPTHVGADATSTVRDEAEVFGVAGTSQARAYRTSMLASLHVVNDMLDGRPIAVTYCSMCTAGVAFEARTPGHPRLTFTAGAVWRGTMLLRDEQTGSLWRQLDGMCVHGSLRGRRLARVDAGRHARWTDWLRDHPGTRVMAADDEAAAAQIEGWMREPGRLQRPAFVTEMLPAPDGRLDNDAPVYGVRVGDVARAYALAGLAVRGVVDERLGGVPVSVWYDPGAKAAVAFDRRVDERTLTFEARGDFVVDRETSSRWTLDGLCVDGPQKGRRLALVEGTRTQWYAWRTVFEPTTLLR